MYTELSEGFLAYVSSPSLPRNTARTLPALKPAYGAGVSREEEVVKILYKQLLPIAEILCRDCKGTGEICKGGRCVVLVFSFFCDAD